MPNLAQSPRARAVASSAAVVLAALLAGCGPVAGGPTAPPAPEPTFASDEEAYEAAIAVYEKYLEVTDDINNAGGKGAERVLDVTDRLYGNQMLREIHAMQDLGVRITGRGTFRAHALLEIDATRSELKAQICQGVGDTRVIDADGTDITPVDRAVVTPVIVAFTASGAGKFVVSGSDLWSGENFC